MEMKHKSTGIIMSGHLIIIYMYVYKNNYGTPVEVFNLQKCIITTITKYFIIFMHTKSIGNSSLS